MRFFTFPEVHTEPVSLRNDPRVGSESMTVVEAGKTYFLAKDRTVQMGQQVRINRDPEDLSISFDIDPTVSKIENENMKLVEYMRERYLTVDIYDADSKFIFATAKIPMFDLLRQTKSNVVRAKEVEASAPDSSEMRASLQVIMQNKGKHTA